MNALALADVPATEVAAKPPFVPHVRTPAEDRALGRDLCDLRPKLLRFAYRLCGCPIEAEDLVGDATVRAWYYRERFRPGTSLSAWTFLILRNGFLSKVRRGRFSGGSVEDLPESMLPSCFPQQWAVLDLADALRAMALLHPDQRAAIEMVGAGASYEETAEELNVSVGTVKSRVARGRDRLDQLLS